MKIEDRIFATSAYLFGIPALYIVLTGHRKQAYLGKHGEKAFYLWCLYFLIFFGWRSLEDYIWSNHYLPSLNYLELALLLFMGLGAVWQGYRAFVE